MEKLIPPQAPETAAAIIQAPARKKTGPKRKLHAPSVELQELKDRYLEWMRATRFAEATIKGTHFDLEWFYRYLGQEGIKRIADVTPEILNSYSLSLRARVESSGGTRAMSLSHLAHRINGIRRFFAWLTQNMIVLVNSAEDLELPKITQTLPRVILTQEEARRLLDGPDLRSPVGYRDKALLEVLYSTGVRSGELFKLKVQDFNEKDRTLFVRQGKGGKDRILPLATPAVAYLSEYLAKIRPAFASKKKEDDGTLFLNYTGGPTTLSDLREIFKRVGKAVVLDKRVTAMTLRHSIASHLLENGMSVRYIQEFLGHESLKTTQIYTKVTLSGLRKHYNRHHPKERRNGRNMTVSDSTR